MSDAPPEDVIVFDLERVPTVEQGLSDAHDRYLELERLFRDSFPTGRLVGMHLALMSFVNRAMSLHAGVASAVEQENPHVAFTILRAYLELVATINYVDAYPSYFEALKRPMRAQPRGTRKRFAELFQLATTEFPEIAHRYAVLNEMAHFGSTAFWHPFNFEDEERLDYATAPHWQTEDDPRLVLALLADTDEWAKVVIQAFVEHHVLPQLNTPG